MRPWCCNDHPVALEHCSAFRGPSSPVWDAWEKTEAAVHL
jgi:hypothetical protein